MRPRPGAISRDVGAGQVGVGEKLLGELAPTRAQDPLAQLGEEPMARHVSSGRFAYGRSVVATVGSFIVGGCDYRKLDEADLASLA